ncbi:polynucleotide 5'-hydroxyl-kinase NOL9 isoform X2 [Silene latifolia]|uniref:polynucleotide 5'-hydroxyl-kinase NOL9 isoform X2 n=1 Tax=Silene latifolia TaxID=37657 RepID=UPI003D785A82
MTPFLSIISNNTCVLAHNETISWYKRVAYLDTDVGQPEFTPSGCLSLTIIDQATPDLTIPCLKTPERCYFFGDLSSKRDPEGYLNCVVALYDHYKREHSSSRKNGISADVPLIVNTPGWVKGIGFDVLVGMLKHMAPTHVVKINISSEVIYLKRKKINPEDKNLPPGLFWLDVDDNDDAPVNLLEIMSASKDCNGRPVLVQKAARLNRELRLMVYFRQCFPSDASITTIKELAHALASHTPYQVPISCIKIRHLHCQVPTTEVLYSLNATVIGLAVSSGDCQSLPSCVGLGIVRGIDVSKNLLYMITPVPLSILATVDIILQGFIQIPTSLLQVQGCISPYMSANVLPEESSQKTVKKENSLPLLIRH